MSNLQLLCKKTSNNLTKIIATATALRYKSDWVPQEKVTHTGQVVIVII